MFRFFLFAIFMALANAAAIAQEYEDPTPPLTLVEGLRNDRISDAIKASQVEVRLLDPDTSRPLWLYSHKGYKIALGDPGKKYHVSISNPLDERIRVVISIDGLNPRDSKRAFLGASGYVIDPGKTLVLKDMSHKKLAPALLSFRSFNADPSQDASAGSIAIAVYRERMDYPFTMPWSYYSSSPNPGTVRTRHGRQEWLPPTGARFRPVSPEPSSNIHLEYDSVDRVRKRAY